MRVALVVLLVLLAISSFGQNAVRLTIKNAEDHRPIIGASAFVPGTTLGNEAGSDGSLTISNIPDGEQEIIISAIGFRTTTIRLSFPQSADFKQTVFLQPTEETLEEVVITSTRSSRTFAEIPTRVEFIAGEELDEKSNMKPGDIRMLLSESTGIQVQQTSATSANASIRIQGLDGRYTQILKDGFPLYAGFSGGLGLLQTPPLDLKQVEVIKGSSSTLYGGGAIAGLVNLISRTPKEEPELNFFINATSAKGLDMNWFYGQDFGKIGVTSFVAFDGSKPYDPAGIGLTAIPKFAKFTANHRVFLDVVPGTTLTAGLGYVSENRIGGDLAYIEGRSTAVQRYFESNKSDRISTQISIAHQVSQNLVLNIKNSFNFFNRFLESSGYWFDGKQNSTFTEMNLVSSRGGSEFIVGANAWTDNFAETNMLSDPSRNYHQATLGAFVQNSTRLSKKFSLESGIRWDHVRSFKFVVLPRLSLLYKHNSKLSSRLGGGFGYKAPTIFTEETERILFKNVLPISDDNTLEKSYGANWDVNYTTSIGDVGITVNHLFFYTKLMHPLSLTGAGSGYSQLINLIGFIETAGTETNIRLDREPFKLFVGYTFTDTRIRYGPGSYVHQPLTPMSRLNNVLMYEVERQWKLGLEAYYFSRQRLSDNTFGQAYWIVGFMGEHMWKKFSAFVNFENFLDARQTRFDTIYTGSISNPVFRDIYAPLDGFVVNGGVKVKL